MEQPKNKVSSSKAKSNSQKIFEKFKDKPVTNPIVLQSEKCHKAAVKIQAAARRYIFRSRFKDWIKELAKSNTKPNLVQTNETAVQQVSKAVEALGFSLEMIYRACDADGTGEVSLDSFKDFFKKLKLKDVTKGQLTRFFNSIDEECSGIVKKEEFLQSLSSYGVATESKQGQTGKSVEQDALLKFAGILKGRNITPAEVFSFCDLGGTGLLNITSFTKFVGTLNDQFQEKETFAFLNYFDSNQTRKIKKDNFIREVEKAMKNATTISPYSFKVPRIDVQPKEKPSSSNNIIKNNTKPPKPKDTPTFGSRENAISQDDSESKPVSRVPRQMVSETAKKREESESKKEVNLLKKIIVKMELNENPIYKFLEKFMTTSNISAGVPAREFSSKLDQEYGKTLTAQERKALMEAFDVDLNGTVDVYEVQKFFLTMARASKEKVVSGKLLMITLAKILDTENKQTEDFFQENGISPRKKYSVTDFSDKMKGFFEFDEASGIFSEYDTSQNGEIDAANILNEINQYRSKSETPKNTNVKKDALTVKDERLNQAIKNQLDKSLNVSQLNKTHDDPMEAEAIKELKIIKRAIVKLELEGSPIHLLFDDLLKMMTAPRSGININEVSDKWKKNCLRILVDLEFHSLIHFLDHNRDGIIDMKDVKSFLSRVCHESKENIFTTGVFELSFARLAQFELLTTDKFVQNLGIRLKQKTKFEDFCQKISDLFNLPREIVDPALAPHNYKDSHTVEIDLFIDKIDSLRTDLVDGKVNTKATATNILGKYIENIVKNEEVEEKFKEKAKNRDKYVTAFNQALREQEIEPLDFWNTISKGASSVFVLTLHNCLMLKFKSKMDPPALKKTIEALDIHGTGTIYQKDYELLVYDELSEETYKRIHKDARPAEDFKADVIRKLKEVLNKINKDGNFIYNLIDTTDKGFVSILELRRGLTKFLPLSLFSEFEILETIKSLDKNYNGSITKDEFFAALEINPTALKSAVKTDFNMSIFKPGEQKGNELKEALMKLKDFLMNPKMIMKPQQLFAKFDINGDGTISPEEFMQALDTLDNKVFLSERQKVLLLNQADKNKSNSIDYEEFIGLLQSINYEDQVSNPRPASSTKKVTIVNTGANTVDFEEVVKKMKDSSEKLRNFETVFKSADKNGDEVLDKNEFFDAIDRLEISLSPSEKTALFQICDINQDGTVRLEEFFEFIKVYEVGPGSPTLDRSQSKISRSMTKSRTKTVKINRGTTVSLQNNLRKAQSEFDKYMKRIDIKPEHYFRGKKTILNDQLSCLKRCHELVKQLEEENLKYWTDPDFGPKTPEDKGSEFLYYDEPPLGYPDPENIHWIRVPDISIEKPEFLSGGASSNDVIQGEIGDCWLIGGLSVIASQDQYICGRFDPHSDETDLTDEEVAGMQMGLYSPIFHSFRKYGIYVIKFFKNYCWRYVIIDDRLPCYKPDEESTPDLVFGKCRNHSEFWVPLIEKAYAKLHNCYEALIAGYLDDGLTDMTGWVSEKFKLQGPKGFPSPQVESADALWERLKHYRKNNCMMGCSVQGEAGETEHEVMIDDEPAGILKSHAYGIIDIIELPDPNCNNSHKSHRLLRIRNPWGRKEWTGKWSDGTPKLLENLKELNRIIQERAQGEFEPFDPEADDGTFLMSFKDWRTIYNNLFCCVKFDDNWSGRRYIGFWNDENSGGTPMKPDPELIKKWATNPQFIIELNNKNKEKTQLVVTLGQEDGRLERGLKFPFKDNIHGACFTIMRLDPSEKKATAFDKAKIEKLSPIKEYRDNAIEISLKNGKYAIIPSTAKPGSKGKFYVNVYYECDSSEIKLYNADDPKSEFEVIMEEEEAKVKYDLELKTALKVMAVQTVVEEHEQHKQKVENIQSGGLDRSDISEIPAVGDEESEVRPSSKKKKTSKSKTKANTYKTSDLSEFDPKKEKEYMKKMIDEGFKDTDYFKERVEIEDENHKQDECHTILNSESAALKMAYVLLEEMQRKGLKRFHDPDFGPLTQNDLGLRSICNDEDNPPFWIQPENLVWLRPHHIVPDKETHFLEGGAEAADVCQGDVGDCWFIGALSVVATRDKCIRGSFEPSEENLKEISDEEVMQMTEGLFPPMFHWLRKYSMYVIRFFKNYGWRYVIIDDKLPCYKGQEGEPSRLVFAKCKTSTEFWVPLIEKAYAKLHHNYEELISGYLDDALSDMTGLMGMKKKIPEEVSVEDPEKNEKFWQFIKNNVKTSFMGCSIAPEKNKKEEEYTIDDVKMGILRGHAYALIDAFEIKANEAQNRHKSHRLLRIRNPWGYKEWSGKWSSGSEKFGKESYKIEKYLAECKLKDPDFEMFDIFDDNDGTFLMAYKDWRSIYTNLFMALKFEAKFSGVRFKSEFTEMNSGGFPTKKEVKSWAKNPQFLVHIKVTTNLKISLGQFDGRLVRGERFHYPDIIHPAIIFLCRSDSEMTEYNQAKVIKNTPAIQYRQNTLEVENLEPGKYVIVPSFASSKMKGKFFLSIYFDCYNNEKNIIVKHLNGNLAHEPIVEEEEQISAIDNSLKFIMKLKGKDVIYNKEKKLNVSGISE